MSDYVITQGAANIVYKLHLPGVRQASPPTSADLYDQPGAIPAGDTPPPSSITPPPYEDEGTRNDYAQFAGKLLRLHKEVDWIPSYAALLRDQTRLISPLFGATDLVHQQLVLLPLGLIASLNQSLAADVTRSSNRRGVSLALDEPHGMLITDMTPNDSAAQVLVELKPKWLAQSPGAPQDAIRCRTCALRRFRRANKQPGTEVGVGPTASFCPLDLVSQDPASIAKCVDIIVADAAEAANLSEPAKRFLTYQLRRFLLTSSLLHRLRDIQQRNDPHGVLALAPEDDVPEDFLVATTLRDCTLFLRLTATEESGNDPIEARLGDLDLKAPKASKLRHWRETEQTLLSEGWYTGRRGEGDEAEEEICRLGRRG